MKDSKGVLKRLLILLLNFIISYGILRVIITLGERLEMPMIYYIGSTVYMVALTALIIAVFYLNGGTFDTRTQTMDELPEEWSYAEKQSYLARRKSGKEKSKKLMFILLPLLVTVFISYIELWFLA